MRNRGPMNGYMALRWKILERDNFTCQYCGQHAPNVQLEVDHIIPVEDGGTLDPENLKTSCFACNRGRSGLRIILKRRVSKTTQLVKQPMNPTGNFRETQILNALNSSVPVRAIALVKELNLAKSIVYVTLSRLAHKSKVISTPEGYVLSSKEKMA